MNYTNPSESERNGYHAMVLTVDYRNSEDPRFYLSDQDWRTHFGWLEFKYGDLNSWVLKANKDWFYMPWWEMPCKGDQLPHQANEATTT